MNRRHLLRVAMGLPVPGSILPGQRRQVQADAAETDEALRHLQAALAASDPNARGPGITHADFALAYIAADAPELSCQHAVGALERCEGTGNRLGVERVRGVRARMPESWGAQACVRELDERLRMVV